MIEAGFRLESSVDGTQSGVSVAAEWDSGTGDEDDQERNAVVHRRCQSHNVSAGDVADAVGHQETARTGWRRRPIESNQTQR